MILIPVYVYTVFTYLFQLLAAINHNHTYHQKLVFSTPVIIIARLLGRVLGIYVFSLIFAFISITSMLLLVLYLSLIILCSSLFSVLGEFVVRVIVSTYIKHHANKVIANNKDEYGNSKND